MLVRLTRVPDTLSAAAARRVALSAQGFGRRAPDRVTTRAINAAFRRMGVAQIDSVNVFSRSHYMPFFSRLGSYDTALLDRLVFTSRSPYTEYWAHAATFIPIDDWGLWDFRMSAYRERLHASGWYAEHATTLDWVRGELAARGPLRPADLEDPAPQRRGPWWDWSVVKQTLERLFLTGEVAIAGRTGFERRYALASDVIPQSAATPVHRDDAVRELALRAVRSHGVATVADVNDYYRLFSQTDTLRALRELEDAGEITPVSVRGWERNGRQLAAWMPHDQVVPRRLEAAALLTPFDPVVWFRDRAERMYGLDYRIEIYTPAHKRTHGYYSLPVLIDDRIAARVDLKADRGARRLLVQSAWWEPSGTPADAGRIADELRRAAAWQGLEQISVGGWGDAADAIAAALGSRGQIGRHLRETSTEPSSSAVASVAERDAR